MSMIAARNDQKENVDVNNLWRWPVRAFDPGWIGDQSKLIEPELWTWQRWAGGIGGNGSDGVVKNITAKSADVCRSASYNACVFTDLQPGHYVLQFIAASAGIIRIASYAKIGSKLAYSKHASANFQPGPVKQEFDISDGHQARIDFGFNDWTTLTGVKITEGAF